MGRLKVLDLWFFRGLFYAYVGFITLGDDKTFSQPQDLAALVQMGFGAFYCLMVSKI